MGCDAKMELREYTDLRFQSTHPYGVRRAAAAQIKSYIAFQSTHPYGVRHSVTSIGNYAFRFQSTHPYGVRRVN